MRRRKPSSNRRKYFTTTLIVVMIFVASITSPSPVFTAIFFIGVTLATLWVYRRRGKLKALIFDNPNSPEEGENSATTLSFDTDRGTHKNQSSNDTHSPLLKDDEQVAWDEIVKNYHK